MSSFIGRRNELNALNQLKNNRLAKLLVLKGRRRIGKSRLLQEFGKGFGASYTFSGLPPESGISAEEQRNEFARQFERQIGIPLDRKGDWSDIFWSLAKVTDRGNILIIFDEISWMAAGSHDFLSKLKNAWDLYFSKNDQLVLALCGSVSAWIEKNILSSSGFLGRESLDMTLEELPIHECAQFWAGKYTSISAYEKLKVLSVTGGVPRYLELINPKLSAEENIRALCFTKSGVLYNEFEKIFSDLFSERSDLYKKIVSVLADGIADQASILSRIGLSKGGDITEYLNDLIKSGFISRDFTWQIQTGKVSRLSQYRLKDNYSRFYIKYVLPKRTLIESGTSLEISLSSLPGWNAMMGFQMENLMLSNRKLILATLGVNPNDIICDNPYFQRRTSEGPGVQIDYLIQTRHNNLYVCEIKYHKQVITESIIEEVENKVSLMKIPKRFSVRKVLIHVNGVSEEVEDSAYFSNIIDFGEYLSG